MSAYHTHKPFLLHYAKKTSGPILELGMGFGSTIMLHDLCCVTHRKLISMDHDPEWVGKFMNLKSNFHEISCVDDWDKAYDQINGKFSIIFVDNAPFEARSNAIRRFKNNAEFIILHDCDYFPKNNLLAYSEFPYFNVYEPAKPWPCETGPPTLVASMSRQDVIDLVDYR